MNPIITTHVRLDFAGRRAAKGLTIAQFSDIHIGPAFRPRAFAAAVDRLAAIHPDLYVMTGDLTGMAPLSWYADVVAVQLHRLSAPFGKFAIWGNHDCLGSPSLFPQVIKAGGFCLLENAKTVLWPGGPVIGGLADGLASIPNVRLLERVQVPFRLLLLHEPDLLNQVTPYSFDLALAGHTHGGQIRLPGRGAVVLPELGKHYPAGLYRVRGGLLYVNMGLGASDVPLRWRAPGELTVFHLRIPEEAFSGLRPGGLDKSAENGARRRLNIK